MSRPSWHAWWILLRPRAVRTKLNRLCEAGVIEAAPSLWQLELGVLRMWHRLVFRPGTVGTCSEQPIRRTWRARLLSWRVLRLPFLFLERAIAPLDHSGLAQPRWRTVRHLLAAHHDANQFAYDLEILRGEPGALEEVRDLAQQVVLGETRRARWLADLCVFEGYHASLLAATRRAMAGEPLAELPERDDPDITFSAYIRWCRSQPETPFETWRSWRRGDFPRKLAS